MIHEAECRMSLMPSLTAKAGRILDGAAHVEWRTTLENVTPQQLGGREIKLVIKGENLGPLVKLLAALKEPSADVEGMLGALRGLHEGSDPTADAGDGSEHTE